MKVLTPKFFIFFVVIAITLSMCMAAHPYENSLLGIVPVKTSICVRLTDLRGFEWKAQDLMKSLEMRDVPNSSMGTLVGEITGIKAESLMDLEDAGFDTKGDILVFWKGTGFDKFAVAMHVNSRKLAEPAVRSQIGGKNANYKGISYTQSDTSAAWVFLDDVFVYSKDKGIVVDAIETHLGHEPSILQNEKFASELKSLQAGDLTGYVSLDSIISATLPLLKSQSQKAKEQVSKELSRQKNTAQPVMNFDVAKILSAEMDMGLWILEQLSSYSISMDIGKDGIWINDSLKFKPDSPICEFLNVQPRKLNLVSYLPGDILIAGGAFLDDASIEKINSVMFDLMMPVFQDKLGKEVLAELRGKYETKVHEILSCLGDEVAFAMSAKADLMIPRLTYILKVDDEARARKTIGNLDYIKEIAEPFYKALDMEVPITDGPSRKYSGIQINSFQIDISKMTNPDSGIKMPYPERMFLWYAFVDGKMIYASSQTADTIKEAIDAIKGRQTSISNSASFKELNIRLPERSNALVYISPEGYMKFATSMIMSQMGVNMPDDTAQSSMGFAIATNFTGDGISNSVYVLTKEIQKLLSAGMNFSPLAEVKR